MTTDTMNEVDVIELHDNSTEDQYLTFNVADEVYGIEILKVVEIITSSTTITKIPKTWDFMKGVMNLRGKIIPVMDVRLRFGLAWREYDDRTCIIVVHEQDMEIGIIVDRVAEVIDIPKSNLELMPQIASSSHQRFVRGIGKVHGQAKIILDLKCLLFDEEMIGSEN